MNSWKAQRILSEMRFKYSITNPGIDKTNEKQALEIGAMATDKQIGKMPRNHDEDKKSFECPTCEKTIIYLDEKERHKHCLNCGQALLWH